MTRTLNRRRVILGMLTLVSLPLPLAAHPLPPAVIVITIMPDRLILTVTLPYPDLALVLRDVIPDNAPGNPLTDQMQQTLATYFAAHMQLASDTAPDLPLTLTLAVMERATHEDVGAYAQIVLDYSAPLPPDTTTLTLTYDAVIHEIRSQRAEVYLQPTGQDIIPIGVIRLDTATGKAAPRVIPLAP